MRSATKKHVGRNPAYLRWIRTQPCVVRGCGHSFRFVEAAHVGERGLSQRCSDLETIPLCSHHHRTGRDSQHRLGKAFWAHHGLDRDALVKQFNYLYVFECVAFNTSN